MEKGFREQLNEVHRMGLAPVRPITIDLSVEAPDQEFNIAGNFFYIKDAPGPDEYIKVKVNNSALTAVSWTKQTGFIQPFNRLYISTPSGQTGVMTILIASEATQMFDILDHRSAISAATQEIVDQLEGDVTPESFDEVICGVAQVELLAANADRKGCQICSDINNPGDVYLGFDNTVTLPGVGDKKWFHVLTPGGSWPVDNYRGPIHAIATIAACPVGVAEW